MRLYHVQFDPVCVNLEPVLVGSGSSNIAPRRLVSWALQLRFTMVHPTAPHREQTRSSWEHIMGRSDERSKFCITSSELQLLVVSSFILLPSTGSKRKPPVWCGACHRPSATRLNTAGNHQPIESIYIYIESRSVRRNTKRAVIKGGKGPTLSTPAKTSRAKRLWTSSPIPAKPGRRLLGWIRTAEGYRKKKNIHQRNPLESMKQCWNVDQTCRNLRLTPDFAPNHHKLIIKAWLYDVLSVNVASFLSQSALLCLLHLAAIPYLCFLRSMRSIHTLSESIHFWCV